MFSYTLPWVRSWAGWRFSLSEQAAIFVEDMLPEVLGHVMFGIVIIDGKDDGNLLFALNLRYKLMLDRALLITPSNSSPCASMRLANLVDLGKE